MGKRHTFVLSDVHLGQAHPGDGPWMRYLQEQYSPDPDLRRLVDHILGVLGPDDRADLVFGGDVFEMEGPRVEAGEPQFEDHPRTEEESIATLVRIMGSHEVFFGAIADFVRRGHRAVFVVGNHDAQLTFPGAQRTLREQLAALVRDGLPADAQLDDDEIDRRILVRPWFFQTDDGVHVEHGHQYDAYCAFRDPLRPLAPGKNEIHPTVGSLAFRHMVSRMGFFNIYDERSYMKSVPKYLMHWGKHYLFSRRSLAATWMIGSLRVVSTILSNRPKRSWVERMRAEARADRDAFATTTGVDPEAVDQHAQLFVSPVEDEAPERVVREMRADYTALITVALAGLLVSPFKPKLGLALAATAVAAGVAIELTMPAPGLADEYARVERVARRIAQIYRARAVIFGHTHIPSCEYEDGVIYANTGAWTPPAPDADGVRDSLPPPRGRPVVWLKRDAADPASAIEGGLFLFRNGRLTPDRVVPEPHTATEPLPLGDPPFAESA